MTDLTDGVTMTHASLVEAVQKSRGFFRRISQESGCSYITLRRLATDPGYDPKVTEVEKISAWFQANGVPAFRRRGEARLRRVAGDAA